MDTGASTNKILLSNFDETKEPRKLMRYHGLLPAVDRRYVKLSRSAKIHLKGSGIDDECEKLIIDEKILELENLQNHNCVIDLQTT